MPVGAAPLTCPPRPFPFRPNVLAGAAKRAWAENSGFAAADFEARETAAFLHRAETDTQDCAPAALVGLSGEGRQEGGDGEQSEQDNFSHGHFPPAGVIGSLAPELRPENRHCFNSAEIISGGANIVLVLFL
jgi:hypothetical protein